MVFGSIPAYLDPANWQQVQPNHDTGLSIPPSSECLSGSMAEPPPPPTKPHVGSIRPGSMAERARLANIAVPDAALNCPRCESTNTKFCYFNNYSLTQPRHFCKTCRRYWTRGGALRNVPVGGGCRRNNKRPSNTKATSSSTNTTTSSFLPQIPPPLLGGQLSDTNFQPQIPPLSFLGILNPSPYGLSPFQDGHVATPSCFIGGEAESQIIRPRSSGTMLPQMGSPWPQYFMIPGSEQWACPGGSWSDVSANLNSSSNL